MAKRLIDAEELKRRMIAFTTGANTNYLVIENIVMMINQADTVDAVEVCYCKDCKHMEITPDNLRWCNAWNGINGMGDEGYCNYGERRCE